MPFLTSNHNSDCTIKWEQWTYTSNIVELQISQRIHCYNVKIEIACTPGNWYLNDGKSLIFIRFPWNSYSFPEENIISTNVFLLISLVSELQCEYKSEAMTTISFSLMKGKTMTFFRKLRPRNDCFFPYLLIPVNRII